VLWALLKFYSLVLCVVLIFLRQSLSVLCLVALYMWSHSLLLGCGRQVDDGHPCSIWALTQRFGFFFYFFKVFTEILLSLLFPFYFRIG